MPLYHQPGVYVTEIASGAMPIDGVSTSTNAVLGVEMIASMRRFVEGAGGWTDSNASDPGVAVLELFAWLSERLAARTGHAPESAVAHAARLAASALGLVANRQAPPHSVLQGTRFLPDHRLDRQGCVVARSSKDPGS
jgi:phage tail sheath protein FI